MILTTTNSIEGFKVIEYKGLVSANSSVIKTKFSFKTEKNKAIIEDIMNQAKEEAFQKLKENGMKMKANAIIGITIDMETFQGSYFFISAIGTAVNVAV